MAKKYDFTKFIEENSSKIFKGNVLLSSDLMLRRYKRQINALDIKMNEIILDKNIEDPIFLLGLFDYALSQFSVTLKTDINSYQKLFIDFIQGGKE